MDISGSSAWDQRRSKSDGAPLLRLRALLMREGGRGCRFTFAPPPRAQPFTSIFRSERRSGDFQREARRLCTTRPPPRSASRDVRHAQGLVGIRTGPTRQLADRHRSVSPFPSPCPFLFAPFLPGPRPKWEELAVESRPARVCRMTVGRLVWATLHRNRRRIRLSPMRQQTARRRSRGFPRVAAAERPRKTPLGRRQAESGYFGG